eukprot:scaffold121724_cov27-Tisochrysis_lutea.AAC.1
METERHSVAGRLITGALSKSPSEAGLINTDIGSNDRLAQQNLQIPAHLQIPASNRAIPRYLLTHRSPTRLGSPPAILMLS